MLRVLGRLTSSNVQKVTWLLAELGVPYEQENIGGSFGGNRGDDYLKLNPNGLVPTLCDGAFVLWESNSICRYLATTRGPTALYPSEPQARASCERWMDWHLTTLAPAVGQFYIMLVRTPPAERDAEKVEALRANAHRVLRLLEGVLALHPYVNGEDFTLADICMGMWPHRWKLLGGADDDLPHVRSWYQRLAQRPAYQANVMAIPLA